MFILFYGFAKMAQYTVFIFSHITIEYIKPELNLWCKDINLLP